MSLNDFSVGIQLADYGGKGGFGQKVFTPSAETSFANINDLNFTPFAGDSNRYDPDAAKIILQTYQFDPLYPIDFRIVAQAADRAGTSQFGTIQATPWASEGGGISGFITDANGYDPDVYRLAIETRPWQNSNFELQDFRLGIQLGDRGGLQTGSRVFTPFASQGGGESSFGLDANGYDFDGFTITLDVQLDPIF